MTEDTSMLPLGSMVWIVNASLAGMCVVFAALAAGLTMGLVAIEPFRLQILLETKEEHCTSRKQLRELREEKECARRLLPVVSQHHLLLVTLLLVNSMANECLPLFLDEILPRYLAIITSVTFVLLFGEIIPSAIFTGPNQLAIASWFVPLVQAVMFFLCPLAWPISKLLDYILGHEHPEKFNKAELRALVKLHVKEEHQGSIRLQRRLSSLASEENQLVTPGPSNLVRIDSGRSELLQHKLMECGVDKATAAMAALATTTAQDVINDEEDDFLDGFDETEGVLITSRDGKSHEQYKAATAGSELMTDGGLESDEVLIMQGALDLKDTYVKERMIHISRVYMLSTDTLLTMNTLADIVATGHSRVPVYDGERCNIRGLLLIKKLIVVDPGDCRRLDTLYLHLPIYVRPTLTLLDVLKMFQEGSSHFAVITDDPNAMEFAAREHEKVPDEVNVFGVITLEDIIETLIQADIVDETDFEDSVKHSMFWHQRKSRIMALALKQKAQRKHQTPSMAALAAASKRFIGSDRSSKDNKDLDTMYGALGSTSIAPRSLGATYAPNVAHIPGITHSPGIVHPPGSTPPPSASVLSKMSLDSHPRMITPMLAKVAKGERLHVQASTDEASKSLLPQYYHKK